MLTMKDLSKIEAILDKKFNEKFSLFLTRDIFYQKTNEALCEIRKIRQELHNINEGFSRALESCKTSL